jgi:hypothetical protein
MPTKISFRYIVELDFKNRLENGTVIVPMRSEFRSYDKALKEIEKAKKRREDFTEARLIEIEVCSGIWVERKQPTVFVIDPTFKKSEAVNDR